MSYDILDTQLDEDHNSIREKTTILKKIQATFFDYLFFTLISTTIAIVPAILFFVLIATASLDGLLYSFILMIPFSAALLALFLIKDIFNGASFGKQYSGLLIIDVKTNLPANASKCILRNVTLIFWPLECLIMLFSPSRRLGDFIAGTAVMQTPSLTFAEIRQRFRERERGKLLKYWGGTTLFLLGFVAFFVFA